MRSRPQLPATACEAMVNKGEPETPWPYEEPEVPALPAPYQLRSERARITEKEDVGESPSLAFASRFSIPNEQREA